MKKMRKFRTDDSKKPQGCALEGGLGRGGDPRDGRSGRPDDSKKPRNVAGCTPVLTLL